MLRKSTLNSKKIPLSLYKKFVDSMPICCVDMVFRAGQNIYLFKRAYEPAKGKWWLVGGRVLKGERLKDAATRKVKEEVGVDSKIISMIGVYETFFKTSRFNTNNKSGAHSLSVCFLVEPKNKDFKLKLNEEYTDFKTVTKIGRKLDPYVRSVLRDSGVIK